MAADVYVLGGLQLKAVVLVGDLECFWNLLGDGMAGVTHGHLELATSVAGSAASREAVIVTLPWMLPRRRVQQDHALAGVCVGVKGLLPSLRSPLIVIAAKDENIRLLDELERLSQIGSRRDIDSASSLEGLRIGAQKIAWEVV